MFKCSSFPIAGNKKYTRALLSFFHNKRRLRCRKRTAKGSGCQPKGCLWLVIGISDYEDALQIAPAEQLYHGGNSALALFLLPPFLGERHIALINVQMPEQSANQARILKTLTHDNVRTFRLKWFLACYGFLIALQTLAPRQILDSPLRGNLCSTRHLFDQLAKVGTPLHCPAWWGAWPSYIPCCACLQTTEL